MSLLVSTLSPICSSDIGINLPFARVTSAVDGKQPPDDDDDGGGGDGTNKQVLVQLLLLFSFITQKNVFERSRLLLFILLKLNLRFNLNYINYTYYWGGGIEDCGLWVK